MVRRLGFIFTIALVLALGTAAPQFARVRGAAAANEATASVFPDIGTLRTAYTFSATGLTPGHAVDIALFDAVGNRYTYQKDGVDQGIVVDQNGNASLYVTPATDLSNPVPGPWRAVFQEEETGLMAIILFDVGT